MHHQLSICQSCQPFVISPSKGDFVQQMESILNQVCIKNWRYAKDFSTLVKEMLPLRVRIAKGLTDAFRMNSTIMDKVQANVEEAGSAIMVGFWSKNQFNLAMDCLNHRRVLFTSGFSTGKTISMIHCMEKLLEIGEKVLFVIAIEIEKSTSKNCPTLLKMKIQNHFDKLRQSGLFSDPQQFRVEEVETGKRIAFNDLCAKYQDFHFFVDEVKHNSSSLHSKHGMNIQLLKYCSQKTPPHLHL